MDLYRCHPQTCELLPRDPARDIARIDPLETKKQGNIVYLVPGRATTKKPPATGENETARFDPAADEWVVVADYRRVSYWDKKTGAPADALELGQTPGAGLTDQPPPRYGTWSESAGEWEIDTAAWKDGEVRRKRDALLASSDYLMLPDAPISASERTAWVDYRQALRDFPDTLTGYEKTVVWPDKPATGKTVVNIAEL